MPTPAILFFLTNSLYFGGLALADLTMPRKNSLPGWFQWQALALHIAAGSVMLYSLIA